MNRKGRPWHFIVVAVLILVFAVTSLFGVSYQYGDIKTTYIKGVSDIRFGIDIRGGVSVTFVPAEEIDATDEQLDAAQTVINERLIGLGVTDYESYIDYNNDQIIVRFPWRSDETNFDPQQAIDEIGTTAQMVFREGSTADGAQILTGDEVQSASPTYDQSGNYAVALSFTSDGAADFADATTRLAEEGGVISIWLDDENISTATVNEAIVDGNAIIQGDFTLEEVETLANQINSGALPFALTAGSFSTISPTLGSRSLDVMVLAGVLAFVLIAVMMIARCRARCRSSRCWGRSPPRWRWSPAALPCSPAPR